MRFDKVVLRLIGGLQAALREAVPDGRAVMLTVTAPIRLPGKTAAALEARIHAGLTRRPAKIETAETIHGNRVRVRIVKDVSAKASKVIGFVHNPETDAEALLDLTQSLLQQIGTAADKPMPKKFTSVAPFAAAPYAATRAPLAFRSRSKVTSSLFRPFTRAAPEV